MQQTIVPATRNGPTCIVGTDYAGVSHCDTSSAYCEVAPSSNTERISLRLSNKVESLELGRIPEWPWSDPAHFLFLPKVTPQLTMRTPVGSSLVVNITGFGFRATLNGNGRVLRCVVVNAGYRALQMPTQSFAEWVAGGKVGSSYSVIVPMSITSTEVKCEVPASNTAGTQIVRVTPDYVADGNCPWSDPCNHLTEDGQAFAHVVVLSPTLVPPQIAVGML